MEQIVNLEPICAKYGRKIIIKDNKIKIKDQENIINKALGVLAENGLYAMAVFLLSCHKKEYGKKVLTDFLYELWSDNKVQLIDKKNFQNDPAELLTAVRKITESLPKLILARKVTEQALIFARYHAKAEITSENKGNSNE
jgi:hypothetical protein